MISRCGQKVSRLLLGRWRFPKNASDRIRVSSFSGFHVFQLKITGGCIRGIRVRICQVGVKNLYLMPQG